MGFVGLSGIPSPLLTWFWGGMRSVECCVYMYNDNHWVIICSPSGVPLSLCCTGTTRYELLRVPKSIWNVVCSSCSATLTVVGTCIREIYLSGKRESTYWSDISIYFAGRTIVGFRGNLWSDYVVLVLSIELGCSGEAIWVLRCQGHSILPLMTKMTPIGLTGLNFNNSRDVWLKMREVWIITQDLSLHDNGCVVTDRVIIESPDHRSILC